ncbi:MAG TPA: DUF4383 domain-containing protein [Allosphingosinicella sp.]|jgi:hypothetical protein
MNTRTFAMIFGIVFLIVGVGGFFMIDTTQAPDPDLTMRHGFGHELGLFPVNTVHNVIHIVFGLWGLAASRSLGISVTYARAVAIIYALLTVLGLIDATNTTFGFVPIYGNDVWLHALLALVAAYFGWMHRSTGTADRT